MMVPNPGPQAWPVALILPRKGVWITASDPAPQVSLVAVTHTGVVVDESTQPLTSDVA